MTVSILFVDCSANYFSNDPLAYPVAKRGAGDAEYQMMNVRSK